ncbi:MAG: hypothetical protein NVS4B12_01670 [Ktedonobacteraceae bacterium]
MSMVSEREQVQETTPVTHYDVIVVGAGPYGMTTAAHLRGRGLKVAIFGKPLELWRDHMPKGMFLRSHWWATSLSDPKKKYSFDRFFRQSSEYTKGYPVPIQAFIDYANWFQKNAVPDVDETYVSSVERENGQFVLTLVDGRVVQSTAVVMAVGLYYYGRRPAEFSHMSAELVSHSFDHKDFSRFAGKHLAVIGGGQSAVEYTALLVEADATVDLITRRPIHWLAPDRAHERSVWEKIKAPNAGIAPGWKNWVLEYIPYLFYRFSQAKKDRYIRNHYNAAASDWLRDRVVGKATLHESQTVQEIQEVDGHVALTLSNGENLTVDYVMLSTGYKVDITQLPMVAPSLLAEIESDNGVPTLNHWFQSNVPGLYFVGLTSLRSFGPLFRFVVGNKATARRVASAVARQIGRVRKG